MVTSGPAACAMPTPNGKLRLHRCEQRRRAGARLDEGAAADAACPFLFRMSFAILAVPLSLEDCADADPCVPVRTAKTKSRRPDARANSRAFPQCSGVACRPVVGPAALPRRAPFDHSLFKSRANSEPILKWSDINRLAVECESAGIGRCRMMPQSLAVHAQVLCSAQNAGSVACRVSGGGFSSRRDARRCRPDRKPGR